MTCSSEGGEKWESERGWREISCLSFFWFALLGVVGEVFCCWGLCMTSHPNPWGTSTIRGKEMRQLRVGVGIHGDRGDPGPQKRSFSSWVLIWFIGGGIFGYLFSPKTQQIAINEDLDGELAWRDPIPLPEEPDTDATGRRAPTTMYSVSSPSNTVVRMALPFSLASSWKEFRPGKAEVMGVCV